MFKTNLFGKQIDNPIGLAAGFDKNAEVYNSLFRLGFGFVEVGTVTPIKQYGNPKPRVFRLEEDQALINRLGFNSFGADSVSSKIESNKPTGLLGVNIGPNKDSKDKLNDYLNCLKKFHNIKLNSLSNDMLNFWEKDFDDVIEEHINFLKENLESQSNYSSKFSEILQKMEIFQNSIFLLKMSLFTPKIPCF